MTNKLTRFLLARLPHRWAIGIAATLTALVYALALLALIVAIIVAIVLAGTYPVLLLVYFAVGVFVFAVASVADHLASEYPPRNVQDTDESESAQVVADVPPPLQEAGYSWSVETTIKYREDGDE